MQCRTGPILGLFCGVLMLAAPLDSASARRKSMRSILQGNAWQGHGPSRGKSPLRLELTFSGGAQKAKVSVYWVRYQKYTARGRSVAVRRITVKRRAALVRTRDLKVTGTFVDGHPTYKYKSRTSLYCQIRRREFRRTRQFRCRLLYSRWIVMHRKGHKVVPMRFNPPARPPSMKIRKRPTPRPSGRSGGSLMGCWAKRVLRSKRTRVRGLALGPAGTFRWSNARRKTERGFYKTHGRHIWLIDRQRKHGTRWRYVAQTSRRRGGSKTRLKLSHPEVFRYRGRGRYIYFRFGGPQRYSLTRVGPVKRCR